VGTLLAGGGFYAAPEVTVISQSAVRWQDFASLVWYDAWRIVYFEDNYNNYRSGYAVCLRPDGSNLVPVGEIIQAN
jgi:hypothetical protein